MISLGCAKNLVDAEIMLGSLLKSGAEITNDPAGADAVIVNTCSFIDAAQEERRSSSLAASASGSARSCPSCCRKWTPSWALIRLRRSENSFGTQWPGAERS
jgi:hypothetical protein